MLTKQEIIKRIEAYGTSSIAKKTGLTTQTLRNIVEGKSPSYRTIEKLSTFFESIEGKNEQKVIKTS